MTNFDDLRALAAQAESLTLEFKKSTAEKDRACRTLCAFANGQGGRLLFGVTPEALFREHESRPWNPMIARAFHRRGIIETWGRGTLKVARLMREAGLEPPRMSVRFGAVVVTFALPLRKGSELPEKGSELPAYLIVESLPDELREALESIAFKPRRKLWLGSSEMDAVVVRLCEGRALGLRLLAAIVNRSEDYLRIKVLPRLMKAGRLRPLYPETPNDPRQAYTAGKLDT